MYRLVGNEPFKPSYAYQCSACRCGECEELNTFLLKPAQKMHEFWVKKERRDHIFKQATRPDGQKAYLEFQTLERGSPYTLRMTKMNGEYELCNWRVRYDQVKKMVHDIGPAQDMHSLLGHEAFESISSCSRVRQVGLSQHSGLAQMLRTVPEPERTRHWAMRCLEPAPGSRTL